MIFILVPRLESLRLTLISLIVLVPKLRTNGNIIPILIIVMAKDLVRRMNAKRDSKSFINNSYRSLKLQVTSCVSSYNNFVTTTSNFGK